MSASLSRTVNMMIAISEWRADLPAGLESPHAGHVHVEQHQIETAVTQFLQREIAGHRIVHFIALSGQRHAHDAPNLGIVVDHENSPGAHDGVPVRKRKREHRSRGTVALDGQRAAVRLGDLADDREPEAGARDLPGVRAAIEALEQPQAFALRVSPVRSSAR